VCIIRKADAAPSCASRYWTPWITPTPRLLRRRRVTLISRCPTSAWVTRSPWR